MPRRKERYPDKPWTPDPEKWKKLLKAQVSGKSGELAPKGGWQLWDWNTLKDVPQ